MSDEPESPESSASDEPLGDLARRVRDKRSARADDERSETDTLGADGVGASEEIESDTSFEFGTDADDSGTDTGIDPDSRDSDELFEEMDVSDIDTDEVWDSVLTDESSDGPIKNATPNVDIDPTRKVASTVGEDHIVPKDDYCESCHFFSAPPVVECSYEGSEIVEIVDSTEFRVRNCPVVAGTHNVHGETLGAERDD